MKKKVRKQIIHTDVWIIFNHEFESHLKYEKVLFDSRHGFTVSDINFVRA